MWIPSTRAHRGRKQLSSPDRSDNVASGSSGRRSRNEKYEHASKQEPTLGHPTVGHSRTRPPSPNGPPEMSSAQIMSVSHGEPVDEPAWYALRRDALFPAAGGRAGGMWAAPP